MVLLAANHGKPALIKGGNVASPLAQQLTLSMLYLMK